MPVEVALSTTERGGLTVYPLDGARELGVDAFVTSRDGGVSGGPYESLNLGLHVGDLDEHVIENRRRVAAAIGVTSLVTVRQVHANHVVLVNGPLEEPVEADGLVTDEADLALAILVADCIPVLLIDRATSRFGVVHAGWRGLASGVLAAAVQQFAPEAALHAFLGPAIAPEHYQIGPEVAQHFLDVPEALLADRDDRSRLDLRHVATEQLLGLGLDANHIEVSRQSTGGPFFSDRAQRPCGRFALVAKRAS